MCSTDQYENNCCFADPDNFCEWEDPNDCSLCQSIRSENYCFFWPSTEKCVYCKKSECCEPKEN